MSYNRNQYSNKPWLFLFIPLIIISAILLIGTITFNIIADYKYSQRFLYAWNLSDKSSTIDAKFKYINEFVTNIEENRKEFADNSAIVFTTPNNSFDKNLDAVKSLRDRLASIQKMDPASFQYNTAIQQITAQEQGEAGTMISVLQSCFFLSQYPSVWNWIGVLVCLFASILVIWGVLIMTDNY